MLPSLRPLIAEMLEDRAVQIWENMGEPHPVAGREEASAAADRGAATLRWCDEREAVDGDLQCQADEDLLDAYDAAMTEIDEALDAWMLAKLKRPAEFLDELRKILDDVPR